MRRLNKGLKNNLIKSCQSLFILLYMQLLLTTVYLKHALSLRISVRYWFQAERECNLKGHEETMLDSGNMFCKTDFVERGGSIRKTTL